jgi:uncharacterized protein (DUF433 family)
VNRDYFVRIKLSPKDARPPLTPIRLMRHESMTNFDRITIDPAVLNGQPCIRGMRVTVRRVLELLTTYPDRSELRVEFPELDDEDIRQAIAYAAASLDDRILELR